MANPPTSQLGGDGYNFPQLSKCQLDDLTEIFMASEDVEADIEFFHSAAQLMADDSGIVWEDLLECYELVKQFEMTYGIELGAELYASILALNPCQSSDFEEGVFDIVAEKYVAEASSSLLSDHRIRLLDCSSFEWTQVGNGWVACLDPTNMEVEIGDSGIDLYIELGCLVYTVPHTRVNQDGVVIQIISDSEASSCAALASNLASVAVKLSMNLIPDYKLLDPDFIVLHLSRKFYKTAYAEAMEKTVCSNHPDLNLWNGSIATCGITSCPSGSSMPIYSDDLVAVTEESLLGGCH